MAASQTTLIICGNASGTAITPLQMGFIRAFDVTNGHSKWNYDLFLGSMTNNFSKITIDGDLAVVMGTAYGMEPDGVTLLSKAVLYACNADTGVSSWATAQNFYSSAPGPYLTSNTTLMTTANNRTFLAVIAPKVGEPGMPGDCWVRAFQEKNSPTEAATFLLLD
jgi:outer membrane protein assembly factor BamB